MRSIQAPGAVVMIRPHRFHRSAPDAFTEPTIELAGGSVRCMLVGVHLARR